MRSDVRSSTALLAIVALLAAAGGCQRAPQRPNVLLLVVDTLRADRLRAEVGGRKLTPFLDSLAERSYVFQRAYTQCPWTSPAIASLLTSRYQSQHRIVDFQSVLAPSERTLPEVLRESGYTTAAFNGNILLRAGLGFDQGYDHYRVFPPSRGGDGDITTATAETLHRESFAWLSDAARKPGGKPIFLYFHYMEPHNPYHPPADVFDDILARRGHQRPDVAGVNVAMKVSNVEFDDALVDAVKDLYDAGVASLDRQLQALFTELGARGLLDNTIVVFTADHGEEFKEHGWMGHRKNLYEQVLQIPLLVSLPGQTHRVDVTAPVGLIDIAPTILDLLGIPRPASFEGRPLLEDAAPRGIVARVRRLIGDRSSEPRPVFSELIKPPDAVRQSPHERAIIWQQDKLIAGVGGEREYYNLASDPLEAHPDGSGSPQRTQLEAALTRFDGAKAAAAPSGDRQAIDPETRERMRALGYGD